MQDRRRYMRFEIPLKASVVVEASAMIAEDGEVRDLSRDGLRIVLTKKKFEVGTDIDLKITDPRSGVPVPVAGEIVWSGAEGDAWEIGVRIKGMDKEAKSEILDYVYKEWKKSKLQAPEGGS